jgi:hypothetical protein
VTTTGDRREKAHDKMKQGQREAAERAAAHAEMLRRNKEANAARTAPSDARVAQLRQLCDDYDPAALRAEVVNAGRRAQEALAETPALQALVDLIAAMVAEARAAGAYRDNAEIAGIAKEDRKRGTPSGGLRDHTGRSWSMVDELPLHYLPKLIVAAGLARADESRT